MPVIILATLNAKYIHASLGLRYLLANMGELQNQTLLREYIITQRPIDIAEDLLALKPTIIGLGVYIWNVEETTRVVALIKRIAPAVTIVLGGPEVSYEQDGQRIVELADHVITGWGDVSFPCLCRALLDNETQVPKAVPALDPRDDSSSFPRGRESSERNLPLDTRLRRNDSQLDFATHPKIITGEQPPLERLAQPYPHYTDEDIAHRLIYVEASRGCPFKCEFCLSSLDRTAWPFPLETFLVQMHELYERGARHFKFVDRTFNLNAKTGLRILEFFLERLDERLFLHFELIPDHLPETLKGAIARFPPGSLQFEIGIQTFNPDVQELVSRRQDNVKAEENLRWLRQHTHAHIHADLIAGLPGEDIDSFARGFDRLVALDPHEIQVGILKRLRGTPIIRHCDAYGMRYNPDPPYNILATDRIDFASVQRIGRFARYWDLIANSGRFVHTRRLLLGGSPFARFMQLSDWLYSRTGQTHRISVDRLFDLVADFMIRELHLPEQDALTVLARDYVDSGQRGSPAFLSRTPVQTLRPRSSRTDRGTTRQGRHQRQ